MFYQHNKVAKEDMKCFMFTITSCFGFLLAASTIASVLFIALNKI